MRGRATPRRGEELDEGKKDGERENEKVGVLQSASKNERERRAAEEARSRDVARREGTRPKGGISREGRSKDDGKAKKAANDEEYSATRRLYSNFAAQ